jgi:hypothetical protein
MWILTLKSKSLWHSSSPAVFSLRTSEYLVENFQRGLPRALFVFYSPYLSSYATFMNHAKSSHPP